MISRKILMACCAVMLIAASVSAQDSTQSREGAADHGEMPPMGPPAELKQLEGILGTWKADFQMREAEGAPWTSTPATLSYTTILGGACYQGEFNTTWGDQPFSGVSRITFNRNSNKWQVSWVDNMGAYQLINSGDFADGKLVTSGADNYMGRAYLMRETVTLKSATELSWVMEASYDDGKTWFVNMKGDYTKQ